MRIDILSAVPELLESPLNHSIIKRAKEKSIVEIHIHNIRDWSKDKYKRIDDYSFGPDAGMVLQIEPIYDAITELCSARKYDHVIYTSPDGERLNQKMSNTLSLSGNIIILCGHYKGIDQRIRDFLITKEISIGDYVLTGGELAAAVIIDSVVRLLPGAMSDETSALTDTFQDDLLAPPIYTRPADFKGWKVPDILISGDHKKIKDWQEAEAYKRTKLLRPDLLEENE
ncbi:tRNA (guanosine(37)-N1)-methyltransferase TrmD [Marinilabiliaceae bacterium JC040]|nr:tRNA (guanosine(37)-N1)-methyltransferase TrmD [Marinilabiliaceae bacterium JC040]